MGGAVAWAEGPVAVPEEVVGDGDGEGADRGDHVVDAEAAGEDREDGEVDQVAAAADEAELEQLDPVGGVAGGGADAVGEFGGGRHRERDRLARGQAPTRFPRSLPGRCGRELQLVTAVALAAVAVALALIFGGKQTPEPAEAEGSGAGRPDGGNHLPSQRRPPDRPRGRGQGRGRELPARAAPARRANRSSARATCASASNGFPTASTRRNSKTRSTAPSAKVASSAVPSTTPAYAGPNGVLAEQLGSAGSYSPATRPEIFYHGLPPGFYRLIVNLAQNSGTTTQFHDVTNFQILPRHNKGPKPCADGKVPSAKAAARLE